MAAGGENPDQYRNLNMVIAHDEEEAGSFGNFFRKHLCFLKINF